ncbi:MAG: hypothetical protein CMG24_01175 [Candidatus Marinimicrobia bacterium]|nr:hypothetical protein [Candidatus Neomarinimicrobiota bacterium]
MSKEEAVLEIDLNLITSFTITNPIDKISISKNGTIWEIVDNDTLNIKQRSIDMFFDKVLTVKKETLISKSKEKWGIYSVHDTNATHLSLFDNKNNILADFYIGQSKSNYANSYIRINDDQNVYLTSENIFYYINPNLNYWGENSSADSLMQNEM